MPTPLQPNFTFEQIKQWILANIVTLHITPVPESLQHVPKEKGIYFWFMHPDGYKALSNFVTINPIEPRVENKDGYHLVYIGTAGTGKQKQSNLQERLSWHITQVHDKNSICTKGSPYLSTLRWSISSLFSNDLISTESKESVAQKINNFFESSFKVYWMTFIEDSHEKILNYEDNLVKELKTLFNLPKGRLSSKILKGNIDENATKDWIRYRRYITLITTKSRLSN